MNTTAISGRLTKDPIKRTTQSGISVANFSVAVNRPGTKREDKVVDYFDCVVWRGGADVIEKWFHKGDGIVLNGYMTNRKWEKDGVQHTSMEIVVNDFEFPLGKAGTAQAAPTGDAPADGMVPVTDDELPF